MRETIFIFSMFFGFFAQAQALSEDDLNDFFNSKEFAVITDAYEFPSGNLSKEALKKIGDSHFSISNYQEASEFYHRLFENYTNIPPTYYYKYAQVLKANAEYELSDNIMKKYTELSGSKYSPISDYKAIIEKREGSYEVEHLSINSKYSDFTSSVNGNYLIVASSVDTDKEIHKMTNQSFLDLYKLPLNSTASIRSSANKLKGNVNSNYHDSNAIFSQDGNTMYFTRNQKGTRKLFKSMDNMRLGIYKAVLKKGKWKVKGALPFVNESYSTGHPSLSPDGDFMYFTSDMPGGYGQSDIYKIRINDEGDFGEPINLGPQINTKGKELFPYVSKNNVLFFSSDHHEGYGGLDVFATDLFEESVVEIINLAPPLNSIKDDFGYIDFDNGKTGFFTSNRIGGEGDDDIYKFHLKESLFPECKVKFKGGVFDAITQEEISKATVIILDSVTSFEKVFLSKEDGSFTTAVICSEALNISVSKEGYLTENLKINVDESIEDLKINLKKNDGYFTQNDRGETIVLIEPIYFDLNKAFIRKDAKIELDKVVAIMKKYKDIKIVGTSHTDSRGSTESNFKLSQRRATSTVNYIISKGISIDRISSKGYGETQLTNNCLNGVKCPEKMHQSNRRTEFVIFK